MFLAPTEVRDVLVYNISKNVNFIRFKLPDPPNGVLKAIRIRVYYKSSEFVSKSQFEIKWDNCTLWPSMLCSHFKNDINGIYRVRFNFNLVDIL